MVKLVSRLWMTVFFCLFTHRPAQATGWGDEPDTFIAFHNENTDIVESAPSRDTQFKLDRNSVLLWIRTYHWNDGKGVAPGSIGIKGADGTLYGPWPARGLTSKADVQNAFWEARPDRFTFLPSGTYAIVDSDPSSWSHNAASGNAGISEVGAFPWDEPGQGTSWGDDPQSMVLFHNENPGIVKNEPSVETEFTLDHRSVLLWIRTYHWNDGKGANPDMIGLVGEDGTFYGPWPAKGLPGQGGVQNAYWEVRPDSFVLLPPMTYMILDVAPSSWSQNDASGNAGIAEVGGIALDLPQGTQIPQVVPDPGAKQTPPEPLPEAQKPAATQDSIDGLLRPGEVLIEGKIGPEGGVLDVLGKISLTFPAGAVTAEERITIREIPKVPSGVVLFSVDRERDTEPFATPLQISMPAERGDGGETPIAIQEMGSPFFAGVPGSQYDAERGELRCQVYHFSFLGWFNPGRIVRTFGVITGIAVGCYVVSATAVVSLPVKAGIILLSGSAGAAVAPAAVDAYDKYHCDTSIQFDDRFRIYWTQNQKDSNALPVDTLFEAFCDRDTHKALAFSSRVTNEERGYLSWLSSISDEKDREGLGRVEPRIDRLQVPDSVFYLVTELLWAEEFYSKTGFLPPDQKVTFPRPTEAVIVDKGQKDVGEWDGDRFIFDKVAAAGGLSTDPVKKLDYCRLRQSTVAHESWHAAFHLVGYHPPYDWWNEAMAVAFESEVFPDDKYNHFLIDYPADKVAISLRTGFVEIGTPRGNDDKYYDAQRVKRGYWLWPWGKFLLHKGYKETIGFGMSEWNDEVMAQAFEEFAMALLCSEKALPDTTTPAVPTGATSPLAFLDRFPMGLDREPYKASQSTSTGWDSLKLDTMTADAPWPLGLASAHPNFDVPPELLYPRPLSFTLLNAHVMPPDSVASLAGARTPPPLVIHREKPEEKEIIVVMHPTKKDPKTGRRHEQDLLSGRGVAVVPTEWFDWSTTSEQALEVALIGTATEKQTPLLAPHPSASGLTIDTGKANPMSLYFLMPPGGGKYGKLSMTTNGVLTQDTVNLEVPQILIQWEPPDLGPGLRPGAVLSGYRVFTKKQDQSPVMVEGLLLPADESSHSVPEGQLGKFDAIGLASEDAVAKDQEGRPLLSPIHWFGEPVGEARLVAPKEAVVSEYFDAEVVMPKDMAGKAAKYEWSTGVCIPGPGDTPGPKRRLQIPFLYDSRPLPLSVMVTDASNTVLCVAQAEVVGKLLALTATQPAGWVGLGAKPEAGFNLQRSPISPSHDIQYEGTSASIRIALSDVDNAQVYKASDHDGTMRVVTADGFEGDVYWKRTYSTGYHGMGEIGDRKHYFYRCSSKASLAKGGVFMDVDCYVNVTGSVNENDPAAGIDDRPWMQAQIDAILKEIDQIMASLRTVPSLAEKREGQNPSDAGIAPPMEDIMSREPADEDGFGLPPANE